MTTKQAEEIILKYTAGTATEEEKSRLETWYVRFKDLSGDVPAEQLLRDQQESWMLLEKEYLDSKLEKEYYGKKTRLWPRIAAAAAAIAVLTLGTWLYKNEIASPRKNPGQDVAYTNDIAPGKNGATITLANGKVIRLSDAKSGVVIRDNKLSYNDGEEILRDAQNDKGLKGQDAVAKTAKGQTYEFTLPDGTKVWLNAASTLTIPSDFSGTETRRVELAGEAYFEVAKNKRRPFIVETAESAGRPGQQVEVLGTHFNINSYADEAAVKTTLLEGSVRVASALRHAGLDPVSRNRKTAKQDLNSESPEINSGQAKVLKQVQDDDRFKQGGEAVILKPNQQASLTTTNKIKVKEVDVSEAVAWKAGDFIFTKESLADIMKAIGRWYDVEVNYDQGVNTDQTFSVLVPRNKNISQILRSLEKTGKVKFKIEGKKVHVGK